MTFKFLSRPKDPGTSSGSVILQKFGLASRGERSPGTSLKYSSNRRTSEKTKKRKKELRRTD
jgi:hypothetical protein